MGGQDVKFESGALTGKETFRQTGVASRVVTIDKPAVKETRDNITQTPKGYVSPGREIWQTPVDEYMELQRQH